MDPASERLAGIAFGRFQVLPDRREVLADGRPVKLGGRAFDVLMALLEARGGVVSKEALMARVWPGRIIDENSLASQIAALRAAFGAERTLIRTVSGRGCQFTGEIRILSASPERDVAGVAAAEPASVLPPTNAPKPVSELIGRDAEAEEVLRLAGAHRLVTLTGAGGIGKTTLALALARELRPLFCRRRVAGRILGPQRSRAGPCHGGCRCWAAAWRRGDFVTACGASARRSAPVAGVGYLRACNRRRRSDGRGCAGSRRGAAYHRHQSRAAPSGGEWVYPVQPLAEPERVLLRRLAIFVGPFSLEAAAAAAASPELAAPDVIEWLTGLVAKSFAVTGGEGAVARYRLLDTTRAYALEKLGESG
jgi:DNA-binding winged helix-turn-helix (wHTH) protein